MSATELPQSLRLLIGTVVARRYVIEAFVAMGGMAAVFRGRLVNADRRLAIKVLRPEFTHNEEVAARFDREARAASTLEHPNCIRVFDSGQTQGGHRFMVMPLLEGAELSAVLEQLPAMLPASQVVSLGLQLARGLEHAHARGLVHRDLKPDNIFVTGDRHGREILRIVDFGIAKILDPALADGLLTKVGAIVGTPAYMSPEQALGHEVDARADLYALGVLLFQLLQGVLPFAAPDSRGFMYQHVSVPPPPLSDRVPPGLALLVLTLLAKAPEARFPDAATTVAALEVVANELRTDATPWIRMLPEGIAAERSGLQAMDDALKKLLAAEPSSAIDSLHSEIYPVDDDSSS